MPRYIQRVTVEETVEVWIGWEIAQHVDIPGLIQADKLTDAELQARGVMEFQEIDHFSPELFKSL